MPRQLLRSVWLTEDPTVQICVTRHSGSGTLLFGALIRSGESKPYGWCQYRETPNTPGLELYEPGSTAASKNPHPCWIPKQFVGYYTGDIGADNQAATTLGEPWNVNHIKYVNIQTVTLGGEPDPKPGSVYCMRNGELAIVAEIDAGRRHSGKKNEIIKAWCLHGRKYDDYWWYDWDRKPDGFYGFDTTRAGEPQNHKHDLGQLLGEIHDNEFVIIKEALDRNAGKFELQGLPDLYNAIFKGEPVPFKYTPVKVTDPLGAAPPSHATTAQVAANNANDPQQPSRRPQFPPGPYYVKFLDGGPNKIQAIKAVRNVTGMGLADAKQFVETPPQFLVVDVDRATAQSLSRDFTSIGASVEIIDANAGLNGLQPITTPAAAPQPVDQSQIAQAIVLALQAAGFAPSAAKQVPRELVAEIVREELLKQAPVTLNVVSPSGYTRMVKDPHPLFETLITLINADVPVWIPGPAGSGKTHAAQMAAEALGLDFHPLSVCAQTGLHHIMGFTDANGKFHETPFTLAYKNGGLFLLDEADRGNPNVLLALNSALANGFCTMGDGLQVKKHEKFRCVAGANTFGSGPTAEYVGACKIDAATLNRFAFLPWDYDEHLERKLTNNHRMCTLLQGARKAATEHQVRTVVSTRSILNAVKISSVISDERRVAKLVMGGLNDEQFTKLMGG